MSPHKRRRNETETDQSILKDLELMGILTVEKPAGDEASSPMPAAAPSKKDLTNTPEKRRKKQACTQEPRKEPISDDTSTGSEALQHDKLETKHTHEGSSDEPGAVPTKGAVAALDTPEEESSLTPALPEEDLNVMETQPAIKDEEPTVDPASTLSEKTKQASSQIVETDVDTTQANDASSDESLPVGDPVKRTKSGRHVHRPEVLTIEHAQRRMRGRGRGRGRPRSSERIAYTRRARGRTSQSAVASKAATECTHCNRTASPAGNPIVSCKRCDAAWHRFCHDPPVESEFSNDKQTGWLCGKCGDAYDAKVKSGPQRTSSSVLYTVDRTPVREVGGSHFSMEERRAYLSNLSRQSLVDLLLDISTAAPNLALFPRNLPKGTSSQELTPQDDVLNHEDAFDRVSSKFNEAKNEGEGEDYVFVEEHRLYPKPGNGFKLPPLHEDLAMMLEESGREAFSHVLHHSLTTGGGSMLDAATSQRSRGEAMA